MSLFPQLLSRWQEIGLANEVVEDHAQGAGLTGKEFRVATAGARNVGEAFCLNLEYRRRKSARGPDLAKPTAVVMALGTRVRIAVHARVSAVSKGFMWFGAIFLGRVKGATAFNFLTRDFGRAATVVTRVTGLWNRVLADGASPIVGRHSVSA